MGNEFFVGHLILLLSVVHTSCISEGEKYQGKLYKGPTVDTPTKGVRKQEQWLQVSVKSPIVLSLCLNSLPCMNSIGLLEVAISKWSVYQYYIVMI